jgi:hypothetical protein
VVNTHNSYYVCIELSESFRILPNIGIPSSIASGVTLQLLASINEVNRLCVRGVNKSVTNLNMYVAELHCGIQTRNFRKGAGLKLI